MSPQRSRTIRTLINRFEMAVMRKANFRDLSDWTDAKKEYGKAKYALREALKKGVR